MKNNDGDNIGKAAEQVKFGNISLTFIKQLMFAAAVDVINYAPEIINLVGELDVQTKAVYKDTRSIIQNMEFGETTKSRGSCVVKLIKGNPKLIKSVLKPVYDWGLKAKDATLSAVIDTSPEQKDSKIESNIPVTIKDKVEINEIKKKVATKHINSVKEKPHSSHSQSHVSKLKQQRQNSKPHKGKSSHKGKGQDGYKK